MSDLEIHRTFACGLPSGGVDTPLLVNPADLKISGQPGNITNLTQRAIALIPVSSQNATSSS